MQDLTFQIGYIYTEVIKHPFLFTQANNLIQNIKQNKVEDIPDNHYNHQKWKQQLHEIVLGQTHNALS